MAIKTHKVTLSLDNPRVIQSGINVQSFDKQSIQISIELTKNDEVFRVPSDATIRISLLKLARQEQKIIVDVPNTNRESIDWIVPDYLDGYQGTVRVGVYLVSGAENVDLGYFTILSNVSDIDKMADEFTDNVFQGWEQIEADLNELNLTIAQTKLDLAEDLTQVDNTIANINAKNTQVNTLASDFTADVATKQADVTSKYNAFDTSVTQAGQTIDDILALKPQFQSVIDETTGKDVISAPEIILARGGAQTLGERLNEEKAEVTAQLAQITQQVENGAVSGSSKYSGKIANFLGDSQTDDVGDYKSIFFFDWLKSALGLSTCHNYGYSGTTIMPIDGQIRSFVERYPSMDANADLIVVWGGVNDHHYQHELGTVSDTTTSTFYGSLDVLCRGLITKYPDKDILFITPTLRNGNPTNPHGTLKDYADAIIEVCNRYSIPAFDAFRKSGMPINTYEGKTLYTVDGLHLNDLGHEKLGKSLANFILYGSLAGIQGGLSVGDGSVGGGDTSETVAVTGVSLNKDTTTIPVGNTEMLTAIISPLNATNKNVTWSTSDSSVATISNGVVTAVDIGRCTITVTTEDGGFTDTCSITVASAVDQPSVVGKTVTFESVGSYPSGATNLTLLVNASDVTNKAGTNNIVATINYSNPTATISAFGSKGLQTFPDDTGVLNNDSYKTPGITGYLTSTVTSDTITGKASGNSQPTTYSYAKIPIPLTMASYPVSFKINSVDLTVNGVPVEVLDIGGFYSEELFSAV